MSATMGRQGGQVQLEQSDMRQALNMAKIAKKDFSRTVIKETKYHFKKPPTKVREEKKQGIESPGNEQVKAAIQRHPAMLHQNHTSSCLACQNGTALNPQTRWRRKGTGASSPDQRRQRTPEPSPPLPGTTLTPTSHASGAQHSQIMNVPVG
jgi:hypothetical protein